jgi:hypothetical protein
VHTWARHEYRQPPLGITACLYAYSHLSFAGNEICAEQYHLVRAYAMAHAEVQAILAAID